MSETEEIFEPQVEGDLAPEQPQAVLEAEQPATPPEGDAPEETEEPKKKGRFQERIDELVREREEAREEAASWRTETQKLLRTQQPPELPKIDIDMSDFPVPKRENFEDEDEYQTALAERAAIKAFRTEKARDQAQEIVRQRTDGETQLDNWRNEGFKKYKDFQVATLSPNAGGPAITQPMLQSIMSLENGHDLAYWLGKNPQESYRIADLHPVEQAIEIKNLAKRVARPKVKTESTAPHATSPVGDRETIAKPLDIMDPNISFKDYERLRMKQIRERMMGP